MLNISDTIIIGLISSVTSLIIAKWSNDKRSKEEVKKEAKRQQHQDDRDDYFDEKLARIEKKLDEHNKYAKRFEKIEIANVKTQKDLEYLRKVIEDGKTTRSTRTRKKTSK